MSLRREGRVRTFKKIAESIDELDHVPTLEDIQYIVQPSDFVTIFSINRPIAQLSELILRNKDRYIGKVEQLKPEIAAVVDEANVGYLIQVLLFSISYFSENPIYDDEKADPAIRIQELLDSEPTIRTREEILASIHRTEHLQSLAEIGIALGAIESPEEYEAKKSNIFTECSKALDWMYHEELLETLGLESTNRNVGDIVTKFKAEITYWTNMEYR